MNQYNCSFRQPVGIVRVHVFINFETGFCVLLTIWKNFIVLYLSCRKAAAARAKAQGVQAAQQAVAAAGLTSSSTPPTPSSEDQAKMQFHRELMETCIDALARYTFSTCASMPKR